MNILILNWRDPKSPESGGAEIVTFKHAKTWIDLGHQVVWFSSRFKNSLEQEKFKGITIIRKGNFITVYLWAPFFYLLSGFTFDIVIDEIHGLPFFTPIYVRKPKIAFVHEVAGEIWDHTYPFPLNNMGKLIERFYFLFYRNIQFWTDAQSTIEDLRNFGVKKSRCVAIPCPADNKTLRALPRKSKKIQFIFLSRITRAKGVEEILKAFILIKKVKKNSSLFIVGRGNIKYIKFLRKLTSILDIKNSVKFFINVSQKRKLAVLDNSHLLLHASVKEGWGLSVIEGASRGTPAIVYNVAGLKDSVINNYSGVVLNKNTPEAMAREAVLLLNDKKRYTQFQKNCLEWSRQMTWESVTEISLGLLEKIYEDKNN